MSHKVARAEFDGEGPGLPQQQARLKRGRVEGDSGKHHQDSQYRGYKPDFAALAKQYPDSFGPLYVVSFPLVALFA